jgi:hypothetical protein
VVIARALASDPQRSMLLWRYVEEAEQRRRTRAQQQPLNVEEQDAPGG